ncbi:MAG TPA: type II toxin-antitoxin system death-on-curing family toxin [Terracidiphilus sp.]|nr:type II toxin-antitoxin system death-on-curing family toxin [Terracidiphilus sp.]
MRWTWIEEEVARAIHEAQLDEHGGGTGVRDEGALSSALARAKNRVAYGATADAAALAAAYAYGIARNHPFVDGNKRAALVVMELFLELNGWLLRAGDAECVIAMQRLAAGKLTEDALAEWVRSRAERAKKPVKKARMKRKAKR